MGRNRSSASFALVEEKREEMGFFLGRLAESADNLVVFRWNFSAFASAAISVLYAMEAARKRIDPDFDAWYQPRRQRLVEGDPITSYVLERRGEAIHVGETRVNSGWMGQDGNGKPVIEHFFSLHLDQPESVSVDVLSACEHTHGEISCLVDEVPEAFPHMRPDYFMDAETLKREGLTVEDIEEGLGLPRGWTFIEGCTDQQRLDALQASL